MNQPCTGEIAMVIETERTILRSFAEADAEDLFDYAQDSRVGPAAGWEPQRTIADSLEAIRTHLSSPGLFAIVCRETGHVIGSAGFVNHNGVVSDELGFALHPAYWGRGIMPEVVQALLRYGFGERELETIWCVHYTENAQCRRVLEKCGFSMVFQKKMHMTQETDFCVLLRQDWEARSWRAT